MSVAKQFITHQEYFDLEDTSQIRHEYVRGSAFAMVGATEAHNRIGMNISTFLHTRLKGTGCFAFASDMKLRIEASDCFYYPDVMVSCETYDAKSLFKLKPVLIVEILSPSTADIDRREKLIAYGLIPSLRQYLLVHQDKRKVELHRKTAAGSWTSAALEDKDTVILTDMPSGEFALPLDEIYADVLQ